MGTANSSDAVPDVTCDGLLLALVANQLRTAWHAGVIDAETAMRGLDRTIREICRARAAKGAPMGGVLSLEGALDGGRDEDQTRTVHLNSWLAV